MELRTELINAGKTQFLAIILPQIKEYLKSGEVEAIITGSVSFGYCDKYSDVDGVIFLSKKDFEKYGELLNEKIEDLQIEKEGYTIKYSFTTIDEFGVSKLLYADSEEAWEEASPFGLYAVANFIIVRDPKHRIQKLQEKIREYYPEKVWQDKILKQWRALLEDGSYNIERDLKRKKPFMFDLHLHNALWSVIILGFLFNKKYHPTHHQWLYDEFKKLFEVVPEVVSKIDKIIGTTNIEERAELLSEIIDIYANYVQKHELIKAEYIQDWWKIPWR